MLNPVPCRPVAKSCGYQNTGFCALDGICCLDGKLDKHRCMIDRQKNTKLSRILSDIWQYKILYYTTNIPVKKQTYSGTLQQYKWYISYSSQKLDQLNSYTIYTSGDG